MNPMKDILQELDLNQDAALIYKDNLTGLYCHSIFQITVDHEIKRSQRYGKDFSLALIDIDRFSFYNENNDHAQGDVMLKLIAEAIDANIRNVDIAARYSGDQFVLIITESDLEAAIKVTERIRQSIERVCHSNLTVSIGLVSYPSDAKKRLDLINKAQEALQKAKIKGGNAIHFFNNKIQEINMPDGSKQPNVLIVDDVPLNLKMLEAMLASEGYCIIKASDGHEALHLVSKYHMDLVLLDVMMPGMDGYEVCQHLKANEKTRLIPVVMVTALDDTVSRIKGIQAGADDFITKPPHKAELLARVQSLIKVNNLNKRLADIKSVIMSIAIAVEAKDSYTQGHVERVANLAVSIGKKLGLLEKDIEALWFAGVLHDVGKIGVPDAILNKNGKLTDDEWEMIKLHPEIGYKICLPLESTLGSALEGIRYHHEKIDGSGYPDGLKGDVIPEIARIIAVVDFYDALTSDRPYRIGMSRAKTINLLREEAMRGKMDTRIIEALIELVSN
jgi:putative two-component system response regulator